MAAEQTYFKDRYRELRYSYDRSVDALYVHLSDEPYHHGVALDDVRHVDYDAQGEPVGVELLSPRASGVDLRALPEEASLAGLLAHLGIPVVASDVSETDSTVLG